MKADTPSRTAILVARGVAFQATHPRYGELVDRHAAQLTQQQLEASGASVRPGSSAFGRAIVAAQERLTVPGLTLHYVLRKRTIEKLVREAIDLTYRQLIVIGGGLDTLAARIAALVPAIEIDHPATQNLKRSALGPVDNLELVPADLAHEPLAAALSKSKLYKPDLATVVVAEGVFMYLWEADVRQIFRELAERPAPTRIVFTFMETPMFVKATPLAQWWLRRVGEPVRWWISPDETAAFLTHIGFRRIALLRDDQYQQGFKAARGEDIAVAERP